MKDAFRDYEYCLRKSYAIADYITLNISSPNTKDLRQLQSGQKINEFLYSIKNLHDNLKKVYKRHTPLVVKIAPDISSEAISDLIDLINSYDIDGIICTNTTVDKSSLNDSYKNLQGGLSGRPLYKKSNNILKEVSSQMDGVGGVDSEESAREKLNLGADLLQIYTGLVFKGPGLIKDILS
jgi:dihydroorotate dehydrogenase